MDFHKTANPDFSTQNHPCLIAKPGDCSCAEDLPSTPGSASVTDYGAELAAPCTPVTDFSPFVQSNEWTGSGQQSMQASPYSPYPADKVDRSAGLRLRNLINSPNPNASSRDESDPVEVTFTKSKGLPDDHIMPLAPALGLGKLQHCRRASFDSVGRYFDSLATFERESRVQMDEQKETKLSKFPSKITYNGPTEDECSDYTTENSDTSAYSQSNGSLDAFNALGETSYEASAGVFETAKRAFVNQFMREVWVRFDEGWTEKFTACAGSKFTSSGQRETSLSGQEASTPAQAAVQKRQRQEDDNENSSPEDNGRAPKRSIPQQTLDGVDDGFALSCPFRKHDPQKYSLSRCNTCAASSWKSVGRVKEHIYRSHRVPIHCTRCWVVFSSRALLKLHSREVPVCEVQQERAFDGITPETESLLKSRKKDYRGQPEPELWKRMYRILFPNEIVPSPYYEPILDENLDHYHGYIRRELPRLVRSRLESDISSQVQAVKDSLDTTIQGCMDELKITYEPTQATINTDSNSDATALSAPVQCFYPINAEVNRTHKQNDSIDSFPDPPTPLTLAYGSYQANNMYSQPLAYRDQESAFPGCFCPVDNCTCPSRQAQFLPPTAFEKGSFSENWNLEEPLVSAGFGSDDFDVSWDD